MPALPVLGFQHSGLKPTGSPLRKVATCWMDCWHLLSPYPHLSRPDHRYHRPPMQLLERDNVLQRLDELFESARDGNGHAVLVRGEAGIGKTSAVRTVTEAHSEDAHILWGGCDDLLTARPLGP